MANDGNSPSATADGSSKRGRIVTPARSTTNTSGRTRKPSYAMQKKHEQEIEEAEKLTEAAGAKIDDILVDIRTDSDTRSDYLKRKKRHLRPPDVSDVSDVSDG